MLEAPQPGLDLSVVNELDRGSRSGDAPSSSGVLKSGYLVVHVDPFAFDDAVWRGVSHHGCTGLFRCDCERKSTRYVALSCARDPATLTASGCFGRVVCSHFGPRPDGCRERGPIVLGESVRWGQPAVLDVDGVAGVVEAAAALAASSAASRAGDSVASWVGSSLEP